MGIKNFRDLNIWNIAIEIVEEIYLATKTFPKEELFGLSAQMRRSSISVPSNIAEGFSRRYNKEYKQFLYIALGSCSELATQIVISHRLDFIERQKSENLVKKIDQVSRMIMSLIKCLDETK